MKSVIVTIICVVSFLSMQAQEMTSKVVLKKGDKIKMTSAIKSTNMQSMMGGEPMEMKTDANSFTEFEVKDVVADGYILSQTLKKMKLAFDGFGQKVNFDSESKEKQDDNPFVKQMAEKLNVAEEVKIGFDGQEIEKSEAKREGDKKGGRGMMRMMGGDGNSASISSAFLIIPKDAIAKGGWDVTTEKEGIKTIRKYKMIGVMGNIANISEQSQTKGAKDINRNGMSMTIQMNVLTEDMILVNIENGRIQMQTTTMTTDNTTIMDDKKIPSTGKSTITNTFE